MATELLADSSVELLGACVVVEVRIARYKVVVRQWVEISERDFP
jgi:hypothetical protein